MMTVSDGSVGKIEIVHWILIAWANLCSGIFILRMVTKKTKKKYRQTRDSESAYLTNT